MVFILAASASHHELETLTSEEKNLKEQVFSIPGLSLNNEYKIF